jgi:predicted secreted protein
MRRAKLSQPVVALALSLAFALPAMAQPAAPTPPAADTVLRLSDTAAVTRAPDEVVATLRAEARGPSAAAAQEAVNRTIAAAVGRAEGVPEVRVTTGGYWSGRLEDSRAWQATQVLTLRGAGRPALLDLVGALQGQGLALVSLHWTLKPETARAARDEATRLALESLQRRAAAVATQLDMSVAALREVRIDAPDSLPRAAPMMAAMRSGSGSYAPPVAIAEDVSISATVEAVVALRPR